MRSTGKLLREASHWTHSALSRVGRQRLGALRSRLARANSVNEHTLREILRRNQNTDLGRRLGLSALLREPDVMEAFRRSVPLSTYADYAADVERVRRGEQGVLSADRVRGLAYSSGTTGAPKLLPITGRFLATAFEHFALIAPAFMDETLGKPAKYGRTLSLMQFRQAPARAPGGELQASSGSSAGISSVAGLSSLLWSSPAAVFRNHKMTDALYLHALFGLRDERVAVLQSVFAPQLVEMFRLIERRWEELLADLHDGTLHGELALPSADRAEILRALTPMPERARQLARARGASLQACAARFWPSLRYSACVDTGSFAPYGRTLRHYLGSVPVYSPGYAASESLIGVNLNLSEHTAYTMASGAAFFELLPVGEEASMPILPAKAEIGREYEIVLTTFVGLYRYRLGDVIRTTGFDGQAPRFEFAYRRSTMLDVVGERVTDEQAEHAVSRMLRASGCEAIDYSFGIDRHTSPPRYRLYLELTGNEAPSAEQAGALAERLDQELREVSFGYRQHARAGGRLAAPDLRLLPAGSFASLLDQRAARGSIRDRNQLKLPRVLRESEDMELLDRLVEAQSPRTPSMVPCADQSAAE